jgi:hypothetical protein
VDAEYEHRVNCGACCGDYTPLNVKFCQHPGSVSWYLWVTMRRFLVSVALVIALSESPIDAEPVQSLTRIYVRHNEALPPTLLDPLVLAGEYNIVQGGSSILTIAIQDQRTSLTEIRTARNEYDVPIVANTTYQLESDVILEK